MNGGYIELGETCLGYQNLAVNGTAAGLTVPKNCLSAVVCLVANAATASDTLAANFREDGTDPTSSEGMPMYNTTIYTVRRNCLSRFKIISADGNTHSLRIEYFGY